MYRHTSKIIAIVMAAYGGLAVAQHQHAPVPVVQAPVAVVPTQSAPTQPITTATMRAPSNSTTRPVLSAISTYRRFDAAEPMVDWRQANKTVEDIGGWRAYAKEAAKEATKEAANANSTAAPAGGTK